MSNEKVFQNKKEDKNALMRFIIILIIAMFVGAIGGGISNMVGDNLTQSIATGIMTFLTFTAPYANIVITVFGVIAVAYLYNKSRKRYLAWDGENEEEISQIEMALSYILWITSLVLIFSFFFFAVGFSVNTGKTDEYIPWINIICWIVGFISAITFTTISQQIIVNFEKEINPEKQGSIYDLNFQKKWVNSCDEAEQLNIYQSAYKSYKVVNITCIILWLFCVLGMDIWHFGLMPATMVTIIWLFQTSSYSLESIRLAKNSTKGKK